MAGTLIASTIAASYARRAIEAKLFSNDGVQNTVGMKTKHMDLN